MEKICLLDWDGTLRRGYTSYDWLRFLENIGIIDKEHSMVFESLIISHHNKEIKYEGLVEKTAAVLVRALKDIDVDSVREATKEFVAKDEQLFPFTDKLSQFIIERGLKVAIISGAPEIVVNEFRNRFNFDYLKALELEIGPRGRFTGELGKNYGLLTEKHNAVESLKSQGAKSIVFSIGNSISDMPLFENAQFAYMLNDESEYIGREISPVTPDELINQIIKDISNIGV